MVAHWYAICFAPVGPRFKSRQGRELIILDKKEFYNYNLNTIIVWVYEKWIMVDHGCPFVADTNWTIVRKETFLCFVQPVA